MTIAPSHLETLAIARVYTSLRPLTSVAIAGAIQRFAPTTETDAAWVHRVDATVRELVRREVLVAEGAFVTRGEAGELEKRLGKARTWTQLAERSLPGVALGVRPDDTRSHARLVGRDAWAAAIVARAVDVWRSGPPPSLPALCDALVWRALGLPGKPKRCPEEVRAYVVYRDLPSITARGDTGRGVRLIAAREVAAPRPDLRALRDALVRMWLEERTLGAGDSQRFAVDVHDIARDAQDGVFGGRKVFISSVWNELRRHPTWSSLTLDEFKARLLVAHRAGAVELARADLVAAMNPDLVASSETSADGASFHFIVREIAS